MDEYPKELLTRSTFWKIIKAYVPNEFLETVDDEKFSSMEFVKNNQEELVQYVLDNSNRKMRMYGSANELTESLNLFQCFPMSHIFFGYKRSEPYNSDLKIYRVKNEETYMSKNCVFNLIMKLIQLKFPFSRFPHYRLILTLFLKIQEEKLKNSLEFISIGEEFLNYIKRELEAKEIVACRSHPKYSLNDYINLFTRILPESCTTEEIAYLRQYVIEFYNKQSEGSLIDPDPLFTSYIKIKHSLDILKQITEKTPHMFSRWIDLPPKIKFKVPAIARLFKNGWGDFFIEAELEEAFQIYGTGHAQPCKTIEGNFLYTIDYAAAEKKYGMNLSEVTILRDSALEACPDGTPIPTNFGVFVISGLDALYLLLNRIIFVHKVFQKLTSDNMEPFSRYLEIIDEVLDLRGTRHYMLKYDVFHRLKKMTADYWNEVLPQSAKDVRNAKPDGFTLKNFKNELIHLGLTNAFPDIADFAELAYESVLMNKREKYLTTCDLFGAIQKCQYSCVLLHYPIINHFLSTQEGQLLKPTKALPIDLEQTATLKGSEESETSVLTKEEPEGNESKKEIDELKTMKDQLKIAKDVIKQLKDRKLEEKLSECQLEIESLKKKLEGHSNFASEIDNLKRTVETGEDRERKLKEDNQRQIDSIEEMKKNMSKLEAEKLRTTEINNKLNEKMVDLKGEVRNAESRLESVTVEKDQMDRENSNLKEEKKKDAELILKLEGELKKEQKQNERQKLESELRLEVEKTNHVVDQIQLEKEFEKLQKAHNNLSDVCDEKDQIIRDLRNRLSKFPGGLP